MASALGGRTMKFLIQSRVLISEEANIVRQTSSRFCPSKIHQQTRRLAPSSTGAFLPHPLEVRIRVQMMMVAVTMLLIINVEDQL